MANLTTPRVSSVPIKTDDVVQAVSTSVDMPGVVLEHNWFDRPVTGTLPSNGTVVITGCDDCTSRIKTDDDSEVIHSCAATTTYYVDSAAGSDAANGTSSELAWRTIGRVARTALSPGAAVLFKRGASWRGVWLAVRGGTAACPVTYGAYGDSQAPKPLLLGSLSASSASDWEPVAPGEAPAGTWVANLTRLWAGQGEVGVASWGNHDVANIILGGEKSAAVKTYSPRNLKLQDQFYFNCTFSGATPADTDHLYFFSPAGNPATVHDVLEVALKSAASTVLSMDKNSSHVVVENLAVRYANYGLHICESTHNAIVRHCDFSWIGGGCLTKGPRFKRDPLECTRAGNGIEISDWGWSEPVSNVSTIELYGLRLWEIYDAAISPQGEGRYFQQHINMHHNIIGHSEYCFEIWAHGNGSAVMRDVQIDSNICYNSGGGWSHSVRPDPSGRHICSNWASDNISAVSIRNNIFYQSVPYDAGYWMKLAWDDSSSLAAPSPAPGPGPAWGWQGEVITDHNLFYVTDPGLGPLILAGANVFNASNFADYTTLTGNGHGSIVGQDPLLAGVTGQLHTRSHMPSLKPAPNSPARSAGVWTGDLADFAGVKIPRTNPTIGAFQLKTDDGTDEDESGVFKLSDGGRLSIVKSTANPVIGASNIVGSQDFCGARDMGISRTGDTLNLVYSGYSNCSMGGYDHCGLVGCCQLMFSTLDIENGGNSTSKATRLGTVLPAPPAAEFYPITTDAFMLFEDTTSLWHMWATEVPTGSAPGNCKGCRRQIGHLTVKASGEHMPTSGWSYESNKVFDPMPPWAPYAIDEPRVYPKFDGGWIMYIGSQGNNDEGSPTANAWCVGYATSKSLNGPWTSSPGCIIGSGNASGYQAEGFVSFSHNGSYFIITNSLGTEGSSKGDWLKNVQGDLWMSRSQTEGWRLVQSGFVGRADHTPAPLPAQKNSSKWPCPAEFPFPASATEFICFNSSSDAKANSGLCMSWCTDCASVGDQPKTCNNGVRPLCSGRETVKSCPAGPPSPSPSAGEDWDRGFTYVTGQTGYALTERQPLFGAYMGGRGGLPGAGPIDIGVYTLRVSRKTDDFTGHSVDMDIRGLALTVKRLKTEDGAVPPADFLATGPPPAKTDAQLAL
jgi:hypothetical protein